MNRHAFLRLLAAGGASFFGRRVLAQAGLPTPDANAVATPSIPWGRLRYRSLGANTTNWAIHPQGDLNLIDQLQDQTSVRIERRWNVADVAKLDDLTAYPLLFMHGERPPELTDKECANLREYILRGGFLLTEDCVIGSWTMGGSQKNDFFFRRMAEYDFARILPEGRLVRLPDDHPVFHNVFDIRGGLPHMQGTRHGLHGLELNGRIVALLSPSDIHCGWVNGDAWFGPGKARDAFRMGANFYTFAMTQTADTPVAAWLVPLSRFPRHYADAIAPALERETGLKIAVADETPLGEDTRFADGDQLQIGRTIVAGDRAAAMLPRTARTVFIFLTAEDINSEDRHYRFLFAASDPSRRAALVSIARMQSREADEAAFHARVRTRLHKMVKRHLGELALGHVRNERPESIMRSPIMGLDDLDRLAMAF